MTRVLVAEDDPLTLAGIEALLSGTAYEVACKVTDGAAVLEALAGARPDLLILDLDMPKRSGIDVLRTLRERGDRRPIVLLTGRISEVVAFDAIQAGLNGLVIKARAPDVLLTCLDAVAQGRRWIDHDILQKVMDLNLAGGSADPLRVLSRREKAVVALLLQGLRNREIAAELGVTEGTVKVHLHNIYQKLGIGSRTELVILASRNEMTS